MPTPISCMIRVPYLLRKRLKIRAAQEELAIHALIARLLDEDAEARVRARRGGSAPATLAEQEAL